MNAVGEVIDFGLPLNGAVNLRVADIALCHSVIERNNFLSPLANGAQTRYFNDDKRR
jgi:hypothetical protein